MKIVNILRSIVLLGSVLCFAFNAAQSAGVPAATRPRLRQQPKSAPPSPKVAPVATWREDGSPVTGLSVSPSRILLTDGSDKMWLFGPDGKLQKTFGPHTQDDFRLFSYDAAISPDGKYAIVASVDLAARLLDLDTEKVVTGISGGMSRLNGVAYSPDGKNVALATASGVTVSSVPEHNVRPGFKGLTAGAGSVAFAPDGATLAVGGEDKSVQLFKMTDGSELAAWHEHEGAVRALAWARDGTKLASGSREGTVRVWDIATGKRLAAIEPEQGAVESLAWSPGGTVLAVAVSPVGKESSARPTEPERNPPGPTEAPQATVQLWVIKGASATLKRAIQGNFGARKIAFAPDGKLVVGFADGRVAAYDLAAIPAASFPASQSALAPKARQDNMAEHRAAVPEDAEGFRVLTGLAGGAQVVAFSRDGGMVAAGNAEASLGIWDTRSGALLRRISGHERGVNSLAWSPDGALLASGGEDHLQVARAADGKPLWSVPGRAVVAGFSPDGKTLFAFVDSSKVGNHAPHILRGWGVLDGSSGVPLGGLSYPMRAAISPDGTLIAADQAISGNYHDLTTLYIFASSRDENKPDGNKAGDDKKGNTIIRSFSAIHGRVNALRWPVATRLLLDEGDYWDGHADDKPIPGKLGVRIFDPVAGREGKPLKVFEMPIVALDENTRGELAVAEDRVALHVFDSKQQEIASWPLPSRETHVKSLAWSPDGAVLAIGIEGEPVRLWRVPHDQLIMKQGQ